jgi:N-acetylglucosaminyldiphosphoundecaprenol N-acetyl-beta-D-mannosaminyltransferase
MEPKRTNILGVGVSAIDMPLALAQLAQWIQEDSRHYVCVTGVHTVTESQRDKRLRQVINAAGMVTPDGMPLVWVSHWLGQKQVRRVYGPDLLLAACQQSLQYGWSHYFYGGGEGTAEKLVTRLCSQFPGLKIAGFACPPFRAMTAEEDQAAVNRINASEADILWVGLGAPKQEYWMADHLGRINVPAMIGVGAAFDFHAGIKKQAPLWMQRSGLEWLFRLASEPRRLWKRYLINNPLFIWLIFLQMTGLRKFPVD